MKIIDTGKHIIKVYDSIEELPILRYQRYNKFLLIDSGIGSSLDDFDAHIVKLAKFIGDNDKESALLELQNMRKNLYMVNSAISPKYMAFAALVYSIDDVPVKIASDEDCQIIINTVQELPHKLLVSTLDWLKKKFQTNLKHTSPEK